MPKEQIYYDKDGREYVLDEVGNQRPPMQTTKVIQETSGWKEYDTSQGHCALCGRLGCHGYCMGGC
jgi:hypothetical protein